MTKLWPLEVFRKFQISKQFKFEFEFRIQPQTERAEKFPTQPQVDWGVDLPQPRSTSQSTWVSTWGRLPWLTMFAWCTCLALWSGL